jgi:hypothetical protein
MVRTKEAITPIFQQHNKSFILFKLQIHHRKVSPSKCYQLNVSILQETVYESVIVHQLKG